MIQSRCYEFRRKFILRKQFLHLNHSSTEIILINR